MDYALSLFKSYHLHEFYLELPPEEKRLLPLLLPPPGDGFPNAEAASPFTIRTAARLLWVTAANALPRGYHSLAEKLLFAALDKNPQGDDAAWVHLNFVQLYLDRASSGDETAAVPCRHHLSLLEETGYFTSHVQRLYGQLEGALQRSPINLCKDYVAAIDRTVLS